MSSLRRLGGRSQMSDWITVASGLARQIDASPRRERAGVIAAAAATQSHSIQTVRRMVRAFRYVLSNCKGCGLTLTEVGAPIAAVEVLERLERNYLGPNMVLRRAVLLGHFTFRELLDRERQAKVAHDVRDGTPSKQVGWSELSAILTERYFLGEPSSFSGGSARSELGPVAVKLRVDWEVTTKEGRAAALFLSPKESLSASRGLTLMDILPSAVTATYFFDRVIYVASDEDEAETVRAFLAAAHRGPIPLEVDAMPGR